MGCWEGTRIEGFGAEGGYDGRIGDKDSSRMRDRGFLVVVLGTLDRVEIGKSFLVHKDGSVVFKTRDSLSRLVFRAVSATGSMGERGS